MNNTVILPPEVVAALNNNQNKLIIVNKLLSKRGVIRLIDTKRPLNLLAKYKKLNMVGWKYSTMQVRTGVEYENLHSVITRREEDNSVPAPLKGREWLLYPWVLRSTASNKLLFRFYTINNNFKPKVKYVIDNHEVQKEDLPNYCLASEYSEREDLPCFDLSIDTIEAVK